MEKLPIYKLMISDDDESGVEYVAMVDNPAIERAWMAFSENKPVKFEVQDEERRIVTGPLMIANLPIYRFHPEMGEFYAVFDTQTIDKIVHKFFKNKFTGNVNEMHDPERQVEGVYMFESFIVDRDRGISPPKGFDGISNGSWFGSYKVDNDEVWEKVKEGDFQGFSVEGIFQHKLHTEKDLDTINSVIEVIESIQ